MILGQGILYYLLLLLLWLRCRGDAEAASAQSQLLIRQLNDEERGLELGTGPLAFVACCWLHSLHAFSHKSDCKQTGIHLGKDTPH